MSRGYGKIQWRLLAILATYERTASRHDRLGRGLDTPTLALRVHGREPTHSEMVSIRRALAALRRAGEVRIFMTVGIIGSGRRLGENGRADVAVTSPAGLPSPGPPFGFLHQRLAGLDHGLNLLGQRVTGPLLREKLQARNISSTTTMSVIGLATPCSPELHRSRGLHPAATYLRTGPLRG